LPPLRTILLVVVGPVAGCTAVAPRRKPAGRSQLELGHTLLQLRTTAVGNRTGHTGGM